MTRVKICGCTRVRDALAAAEAGADFIGLVFAPGSRRRVSVEEGAEIARAVGPPLSAFEQVEPPPTHRGRTDDVEAWFRDGAEALERLLARKRPLVVGVFENQPADEVNDIAEEVGLDLVQLSGSESWDDCLLVSRQVIRAVDAAAAASGDLRPGTAIAVILDSSRGTGTRGDWRAAAQVCARIPAILAGGLTPDNVRDAIVAVRPWGVDTSSGVETDGAKDPEKIRRFVAAVRGTES
ncbi:MAG TPA: phosphoribosylanthranilate isomerase [Dehalococcoidia bacterium]|nr:phosphoribosylanthranilate isomerase [Dehalococcoidia bacterium]